MVFINLIDHIITNGNLLRLYDKVRKKVPGWITVYQLKGYMKKYYQHLITNQRKSTIMYKIILNLLVKWSSS